MGFSLQGFPHKPCLCHNGMTKTARYRATWCQRKTDCFGGGISRQVRVSNPHAGYIWKSVSQMYYDPIWRSLTCLVGGIGWWAMRQFYRKPFWWYRTTSPPSSSSSSSSSPPLRYFTSLHWSLTQFTPASMEAPRTHRDGPTIQGGAEDLQIAGFCHSAGCRSPCIQAVDSGWFRYWKSQPGQFLIENPTGMASWWQPAGQVIHHKSPNPIQSSL